MKYVKWMIASLAVSTLACISSPMMTSAVTPQGLSVGGSVVYQTASRGVRWQDDDGNYGAFEADLKGVRPDFLISYGISPTFGVEGHFGVLVSGVARWDGGDEDDAYDDSLVIPIPMAGLGFKLSTPGTKMFNAALRMDVDLPNIACFTPMMGLSTKSGHEFITAGVQTSLLLLPQTAFINIHPFKGAHIYGGVDFLKFTQEVYGYELLGNLAFQSFSVGIAYSYNFGKKN